MKSLQLISVLILLFAILSCNVQKPTRDNNFPSAEKQITRLMEIQEKCWNVGDLECFMQSYWKSDKLVFIGKSGPKYGWQTTLDNYIKSYPDKTAMGQLQFDILSVEMLSENSAFVIGKWYLSRDAGDLSGHYTLLWKKINDEWVIVADHSS